MPSAEHRLGLRTLYIIPSRFGMVWLAAAALLLLVAIQTGSNSTLLIAFLLLGLMLLAMFLTHDNLQGITLRCGEPAPGFAAEPMSYPLLLVSPTARHRAPPSGRRWRGCARRSAARRPCASGRRPRGAIGWLAASPSSWGSTPSSTAPKVPG